jgi:hypothetical protein
MPSTNVNEIFVGGMLMRLKCSCNDARPRLEETLDDEFRVVCYGCKMMTFAHPTAKEAVMCWIKKHDQITEHNETAMSNHEEITRLQDIINKRDVADYYKPEE